MCPHRPGWSCGAFRGLRAGHGAIGRWFGPICVIWFAAIALGLTRFTAPQVLLAFIPAVGLLAPRVIAAGHPGLGVPTVTALSALPQWATLAGKPSSDLAGLGLPLLILNYLGQGPRLTIRPPRTRSSAGADWFQIPWSCAPPPRLAARR